MQVRFALCSTSIFSRSDAVTDSETFYNSILDFLEDVEEKAEVEDLLNWWNKHVLCFHCSPLSEPSSNRKIFPQAFTDSKGPIEGTARARIKEIRLIRNQLNGVE
jgi:hypothetical protein